MSPAEMESDKVAEVEVEVEAAADPDECTASGGDPKACADCNTTKTPLWRGGPNGPKVRSFFLLFLFPFDLSCSCRFLLCSSLRSIVE